MKSEDEEFAAIVADLPHMSAEELQNLRAAMEEGSEEDSPGGRWARKVIRAIDERQLHDDVIELLRGTVFNELAGAGDDLETFADTLIALARARRQLDVEIDVAALAFDALDVSRAARHHEESDSR